MYDPKTKQRDSEKGKERDREVGVSVSKFQSPWEWPFDPDSGLTWMTPDVSLLALDRRWHCTAAFCSHTWNIKQHLMKLHTRYIKTFSDSLNNCYTRKFCQISLYEETHVILVCMGIFKELQVYTYNTILCTLQMFQSRFHWVKHRSQIYSDGEFPYHTIRLKWQFKYSGNNSKGIKTSKR